MLKNKKIKIILVGGGTAGHINPLLAVYAEAIKLQEVKNKEISLHFVYIGNPSIFIDKFNELNIPVRKIISSRLRRYASWSNLFELPKFVFSFFQSLWYIFLEKPDLVFSKGGPGSLAPVIAARFFKITVVVHESDATPSITTKLSAPFSKKIFLAFEDAREGLSSQHQKKCVVLGNPLRSSFLEDLPSQHSAKSRLGFNPEKFLIVILGGSQGSRRINNLVVESLPKILAADIQIFHQTGTKLFDEVSEAINHNFGSLEKIESSGYRATDFFNQNIKEVLVAADIIVSRAGSSIFEFAALGKPSILIPLPESAQNHQLKNASSYERAGACVTLTEDKISAPLFIETLKQFIANPLLLQKMSESAKKFAKPEASRQIAKNLLELALNGNN